METPTLPITIGTHVEIDLIDRQGKRDRLSVDIVPDDNADFSHGFLGAGTALAKGIMGEKAGTVIPYLKDDIFAIEVLSVAPSVLKPDQEAQQKRQARMDRAVREVEHTNAVVFASSFSGKCGDYDPDSLPKDGIPGDGDVERRTASEPTSTDENGS